jgi:hypothetical protein
MSGTLAACAVLAVLYLGACRPQCAGASRPEMEEREAAGLSGAPLDLNSAGYDDLLSVPGVTASVARAIVDRRAALGCLRTLDDLLGAGGVDPLDLARIRPYVSVGAGCGRAGAAARATLGMWDAVGAPGGGSSARGWAGDLSFEWAPARLRLMGRHGRLEAHGGGLLRAGGLTVVAGEMRGRAAHPIAVEIGRGAMALDGAAAARPMAGGVTGPRAHGSLRTTTGTGERLRGVGLELYSKARAACFAGELAPAWDAEPAPLAVASYRLVSARDLELWAGATGWSPRRAAPLDGGCGYVAGWWELADVRGSAGVAARGCGAAWLAEISARPARGRRLDLCVAGRSGGYFNPAGLGPFRRAGDPSVASRLSLAQPAGPLGEVSLENVVESEDGQRSTKRAFKLRRRLKSGLWAEWEVRAYRDAGASSEPRSSVKLLWRRSRRGWSEVFYKSRGNGSSLVGWRSSFRSETWEVEWGGFSFRTAKSLYSYEAEIVGRPSIKALKGEGLGWYLCIRLEPPEGAGPLRLVGSTELKVRTVLERGSLPSGTFVGLQMSRR